MDEKVGMAEEEGIRLALRRTRAIGDQKDIPRLRTCWRKRCDREIELKIVPF